MKNKGLRGTTLRMKGFDYSQAGMFFVTVCTKFREPIFGRIVDEKMVLNRLGQIVVNGWLKNEEIRKYVRCHQFVAMPQHFHGIIEIVRYDENDRRVLPYASVGSRMLPDRNAGFQSSSQTLGSIVRGFKSMTTNKINQMRKTPGEPVWQPGYHDVIIRSETSYRNIVRYVCQQHPSMIFQRKLFAKQKERIDFLAGRSLDYLTFSTNPAEVVDVVPDDGAVDE